MVIKDVATCIFLYNFLVGKEEEFTEKLDPEPEKPGEEERYRKNQRTEFLGNY